MKKVIQWIVLLWLVCGLAIAGTAMMTHEAEREKARVEAGRYLERRREHHDLKMRQFELEKQDLLRSLADTE